MMQSSELLSRMQLRYDVPLRRMELLRRWCSRPVSGSRTATKKTTRTTDGFSLIVPLSAEIKTICNQQLFINREF